MVLTAFAAMIAGFLYLYASNTLWRRIFQEDAYYSRGKVINVVVIAASLHFFSFASSLFHPEYIAFSFGIGLSFTSWVAVVVLLITNINKETEMLGSFIFPIAMITTFLPMFETPLQFFPYELGSHILISIMAYSLMGLAAAQAILYSTQEKRFRKKDLSNLLKAMPPLQAMEKTLIDLVLFGFIFLSFALISGVFFIEDIFAQHLMHKTFFAILSWVTYATFIFGHFKLGWRGQRAATYTMWAFGFLVISYIGTELVLLLVID